MTNTNPGAAAAAGPTLVPTTAPVEESLSPPGSEVAVVAVSAVWLQALAVTRRRPLRALDVLDPQTLMLSFPEPRTGDRGLRVVLPSALRDAVAAVPGAYVVVVEGDVEAQAAAEEAGRLVEKRALPPRFALPRRDSATAWLHALAGLLGQAPEGTRETPALPSGEAAPVSPAEALHTGPAVVVSRGWLVGLAALEEVVLGDGYSHPGDLLLALPSGGPSAPVGAQPLVIPPGGLLSVAAQLGGGVLVPIGDDEVHAQLNAAGIACERRILGAGVAAPDTVTLADWMAYAAEMLRAAGERPGPDGAGGRPEIPAWPWVDDDGFPQVGELNAAQDAPLPGLVGGAGQAAAAPVLAAVPDEGGADPTDRELLKRFRMLALPVQRIAAPDPQVVASAVAAKSPWMPDLVATLRRELALRPPDGPAVLPPLLFVGPPGCGKTSIARAILEACGLPQRTVGVADGNGTTVIAGQARGWRGGRPCLPLMLMAETRISTVGIIADDLDRASVGREHGSVRDWLLGMLDPHQARNYWCPYLQVNADLSTVSWLVTVNDTAQLPGALLDRCVVLEVEPPPAAMLPGIAQGMVDDLLAKLCWTGRAAAPALAPEVTAQLARAAARAGDGTASLRNIRRALRAALGASVLGEDPLAAGLSALAQAGQRDDRPYRTTGRLGYGR